MTPSPPARGACPEAGVAGPGKGGGGEAGGVRGRARRRIALTPWGHHPASRAWATVLRELREARGWTRADLAQATGLKWQGVDKIERGECCPRLDSVLKMGAALEVPLVIVALVVELRLEGCAVPLLRAAGRWRRWRRIFRRLLAFGRAT